MQQVPMFQKAGELNMNWGLSLVEENLAGEINGAYSITDEVGITAGYTRIASGSWGSGMDTNSTDGYMGEAGAGYYVPIDQNMRFEVYSGMGLGRALNTYSGDTRAQMNMLRAYVQPALGFKSQFFEIAFSTRMALMNYYNVRMSGNPEPNTFSRLDYIINNRTTFFIEPALTVRIGLKNVKFQSQLVRSFNMNNPALVYQRFNFNTGIVVSADIFE
jgi:hypothetical protein